MHKILKIYILVITTTLGGTNAATTECQYVDYLDKQFNISEVGFLLYYSAIIVPVLVPILQA